MWWLRFELIKNNEINKNMFNNINSSTKTLGLIYNFFKIILKFLDIAS